MCSHFPNTFSRDTVQKFRGTPFENPCCRSSKNFVIEVRLVFSSLFPMSFDPPITIAASLLDNLCKSLFAVRSSSVSPALGFTYPVALTWWLDCCRSSLAIPLAWLSPRMTTLGLPSRWFGMSCLVDWRWVVLLVFASWLYCSSSSSRSILRL